MKLGPYAVHPESVAALALNFIDSQRLRFGGIPALPGATPREIAAEVLRTNARGVLWAGTGHFRFMWPSDFGKALRGSLQVLPRPYLRGLIAYMARESARLGRVTSCFTPRRGFDMPYYRADNLPWLAYSVDEFVRATGDAALADEVRPALQGLLDAYETELLAGGLLPLSMTGDWVDTILRPSSTYNNLCALMLLRRCPSLGLRARTDAGRFQEALWKDRWRGDRFTDFAGTEAEGVDAGVVALYLDLLDAPSRARLAERLEAGDLVRPFPMRVHAEDYDRALMPFFTRLSPRYHSLIWIHLGMMYLNGLKRAGRDCSAPRRSIEALILESRNVLEVYDRQGRPYSTFWHSTEAGLSMAAGQYLELTAV